MKPRLATADHTTDHELVEQARLGAPDAVAAIYARYGVGLFRLARRLTSSSADAEDLVHDLIVALPELLRRYEHRDRLDAWLRGVVVRLATNGRRRASRHESGATAEAALATAVTAAADPWTAVDLERAMASLPAGDRHVFVLRQIEGLSHAEIALLLNISPAAARVRYLRAIRRLRHALEPNS